jgi:tetratricopeptide (TPR) repeat protein
LATAHGQIGLNKLLVGRAEETEAHIWEALRLSPRDTWVFAWLATLGIAKSFLGCPEDATAWLRRSIEANRNSPMSHFHLAAALAHLGRLKEAEGAVRAGLALDPQFSLARFRTGAMSDNPVFLAQASYSIDGMRKAGVPEG